MKALLGTLTDSICSLNMILHTQMNFLCQTLTIEIWQQRSKLAHSKLASAKHPRSTSVVLNAWFIGKIIYRSRKYNDTTRFDCVAFALRPCITIRWDARAMYDQSRERRKRAISDARRFGLNHPEMLMARAC